MLTTFKEAMAHMRWYQKIATGVLFILGTGFGTSAFTYFPLAGAFLLLEKYKVGTVLKPLVLGAHLGIVGSYILLVTLYIMGPNTQPMMLVYAVRLWFEGYIPLQYGMGWI